MSASSSLHPLLLLLSSTFIFFFSDAKTATLDTQTHPISGWESSGEGDEYNYNWKNNGVVQVSLATRRSVAEGPTASDSNQNTSSSTLILAAHRTHRKDPLNGFKYYTGGWNYSNQHYWASVGFTAAPFFVIAGVWFVFFALCLSIICCRHFCCRREPFGYSRIAYALSLIFLIFFTMAAIIGCVVLYTGQGRFHRITTRTLQYFVDQADETVWKLRNVSDYLAAAKDIGVNQVSLPSNVQTDIDQIQTKINSSATTLAEKAVDNAVNIHDVLDSVRLTLIVIAAVMMFLTFIGLLFSLYGMKVCVYTLVIFGWLMVAGTFILCGVFLLLHNVTADTCVAMDEWVENPTNYTAIDQILPCVDNVTSQETLMRSKEVTNQLVDLVNQVITNVSNINFSPNFRPFYYNQSGPLIPVLCNPFHGDLSNRTCSSGEVDLNNATMVWKNYVCEVSASGICISSGRLTPTYYNQMAAAVNVSYGLYNYGPFLVDLEDCTFVRQTFTDVYDHYCPHLRLYSKLVYIGLMMVSVAVMLSLVFWVIYGRERKHRVYTKHVLEEEAAAKHRH